MPSFRILDLFLLTISFFICSTVLRVGSGPSGVFDKTEIVEVTLSRLLTEEELLPVRKKSASLLKIAIFLRVTCRFLVTLMGWGYEGRDLRLKDAPRFWPKSRIRPGSVVDTPAWSMFDISNPLINATLQMFVYIFSFLVWGARHIHKEKSRLNSAGHYDTWYSKRNHKSYESKAWYSVAR